MKKEIIISGVGGQGLILCGTLLGEAAVIHDKKYATLSSEYGVETRGTFAKSDVIISDREIYFPDATQPNLVVCLAQAAYARYSGAVPKGTLLLYNADEITGDPARAGCEWGLSLTSMARAQGAAATINIITLGIIAGMTDTVTLAGAKDAVEEFFSPKGQKIVQMNLGALELGYQTGMQLRRVASA